MFRRKAREEAREGRAEALAEFMAEWSRLEKEGNHGDAAVALRKADFLSALPLKDVPEYLEALQARAER